MTTSEIWDLLRTVLDPEVPVLNVVDMGVVRDIEQKDDQIKVTITPTYSGCPAMDVISHNIKKVLSQHQMDAEVLTVLHPPWTTDWLTDDAREKLKEYGIAPPERSSPDKSTLLSAERIVPCPNCGSEHTEMVSAFGSTACKAHYKCKECLEPFDYFKCI